jgi:hypothetical protein
MFRRRTCAILRSSKFLVKYVYATSWVPKILKVGVEYRNSSKLKISSNDCTNVTQHPLSLFSAPMT